jgi:hypothetical protein
MPQRNKPAVTIFSSFSKDILLDQKGTVLKTQAGGPAYFIANVFRKEKIPYLLESGAPITVEILVTPKGEFGRIPNLPKKKNPSTPKTSHVLISTILDEWPLSSKNYHGTIFVDIQGFARNGKDFGKKKRISVPSDLKPFCVKGTEQEISYLPKTFVHNQKNRCLIVTAGPKGSTIFYKGKKYIFKPHRVIVSTDTVGAGDTYLAAFFANFIATHDVKASGTFATKTVEKFLTKK